MARTSLQEPRSADLCCAGETALLKRQGTAAENKSTRSPAAGAERNRPALNAEWLRGVAGLSSATSRLQAMIGMALEYGPWVAGSIALLNPRSGLRTVAFLDSRAAGCDGHQQDLGEGPAHDAVCFNQTELATDLAADRRWPHWSPAALSLGIHRALTARLFINYTLGTINLYSTHPGQIPDPIVRHTEEVAAYASVLLASATTENQLKQAILTRGLIGQAQGILTHRYGISPDKAFNVLLRTSQQHNVKIISIAEQLVATGTFSTLLTGSDGFPHPRQSTAD
jgi:hypothetical protein